VKSTSLVQVPPLSGIKRGPWETDRGCNFLIKTPGGESDCNCVRREYIGYRDIRGACANFGRRDPVESAA